MTARERIANALATAVENVLEAATSKRMLALLATVGAQIAMAQASPRLAELLAPYIAGPGAAAILGFTASDTWGKGKVQAQAKAAQEAKA